jgi:hypothetical protein
MRKLSALVLLMVLITLTAGCGNSTSIVPAEGVVRLDGLPLKGVEVWFVPTGDYGPDYTARAVTDESGRFRLTCKGKPGAVVGESQVVVLEGPLPANLQGPSAREERAKFLAALGGRPLPPKYGNLSETPLTATVSAEQREYVFDLTR